ncbi:hypothetical protein [Haliangium ochraceum]|uniref:Uncharacterized protein n=1 Tax=Haliangium ochraceum (strain DSM 14365 / JCM 11303 / SMP-2) TaxID=502025 RepID=D0LQU6_HALO1|nr:hypothetical protein [Haliangium ochraceum]ACY13656.1 hypothetical protein Hoch_1065 [Haliangium ochraceum DSM 14365]
MKGENKGAGAQVDITASGVQPEADATHIETTSVRTENGAIVVTGRLFRHGGGNGRPHRFSGQPAPTASPPTRRLARVTLMLTFAHRVEAKVTRGDFESRSAAAQHYGMTTGRITQLMSLLWLSPEIQEDVLFLEAIDGREPVSGQALEKIAHIADWSEQRRGWREVKRG